jgi:hypothetical protein
MVTATLAVLCVASAAIDLFPFLELLSRSGTSACTRAATASDDAVVQVLLPLAATASLFSGVAVIHLHHAGNKRLPELATFVLCGAAGVLQFTLFVQPSGGAVDDDVGGVLARALGRAALDALPAGAAAVFFLGITLVIAHIRAGGGGGAVHKKIALGAAAALVSQIAIAALYVNK